MYIFNQSQPITTAIAKSILLSTQSPSGHQLVCSNVADSISRAALGDSASHSTASEHSCSCHAVPCRQLTDQG
ncbi:hypothetical protein N473_07035 [Pseudoalteromonas luteoviolacea CPMOR-1]|uniref:Uncharacterized protein n=1 Tax=Pseudoalteromonas luteoviolacea CPMOR-1 TaxID=1365248 RepID=A0A167H4H2_9GAMM|nr:hypothetical protein [Pseudoalteromonas luteoviolacea]KZN57623.1 hypothetical protein N473_07035 [Pseudoalteromonas luteoviolacea CPMOR-1]